MTFEKIEEQNLLNGKLQNFINRFKVYDLEDLEIIFNHTYKQKETFEAYIHFQKFTNNDLEILYSERKTDCIAFSIVYFNHIINELDKILYACIYCALKKLYNIEFYELYLSFHILEKELLDDHILPDLYINMPGLEHYVLYEFRNKDNIKDYFYELIDTNTYTNVINAMEEFTNQLYDIMDEVNTIVKNYSHVNIRKNNMTFTIFISHQRDFNFSKSYNYKTYNKDELIKTCEYFQFIHLHWDSLKNIREYIYINKKICKFLNIKYVPIKLSFSEGVSFQKGQFGLVNIPNNFDYLLTIAYRMICAGYFLNDYQLNQVIINPQTYMIKTSYTINNYSIWVVRYLSKPKIFLADALGNKLSLSQKRKINKNVNSKQLMEYVNQFFVQDTNLEKIINDMKGIN